MGTRRITISLPRQYSDQLGKLAAERGIGFSEAVRHVVNEWLNGAPRLVAISVAERAKKAQALIAAARVARVSLQGDQLGEVDRLLAEILSAVGQRG